MEGPKATIKRIIIQGNDRVYEDVIRRELRTKPGAVYSQDDQMCIRDRYWGYSPTSHENPKSIERM